MSYEAKSFFLKVKPFCINVAKSRNKLSVDKLYNVIKQSSNDVLQELHEYLLFPLRVILLQDSHSKENAILASASCMEWIFRRICVQEWKTFQDLYFILITQVASSNHKGKVEPSGSEDKLLSVLLALMELLNSSLLHHCKLFYEINHISAVGHLISVALSIVTNEKNKQLRKNAIGIIEILSALPLTANSEENVLLQYLAGNCMASLLPGILSVLIKVVSGDAQQGHAVKCKAIETITKSIKIAAGDDEIDIAEHSIVKQYIDNTVVSERLSGFLVRRDSVWVENVGAKMSTVLDHVITAADHSNANVRMAVLNFSREMLTSCSREVFKNHIGTLLQIPCKLLSDESPDISTKSAQVVNRFSERCKDNVAVQDILHEGLFGLCSRLPGIVSKAGDLEKLAHLKIILGYLKVLKHNLRGFSCSAVHVCNLLKSILFCFQIDCSHVHKIEEVNSTTTNYDRAVKNFFKGQSGNWLFQKSFLHFHSDKLCLTLIEICRVLGEFGDVDVFLDILKEYYERENLCRPAVLLVNEMLLGTKKNQVFCANKFSQIENLIDVYTANENWYLRTSHDSEYTALYANNLQSNQVMISLGKTLPATNMTLKTLNSNVILVCLHLEAIATFSLVLSKDFCKTLSKTLYPLLEKVNDRNHLISNCALEALHVIASSCQYETVAELISSNADYLVSTISIHLRHLSLFPRSPAVLRAIMTHGDVSVFPLVRDTVDEVLTTMDLQRHNKSFFEAFLPVMKSIVAAINEWFVGTVESEDQECNDEHLSPVPDDSAQSITNYLVSFYKDLKLSSLDEDEVRKAEKKSSLENNDNEFSSDEAPPSDYNIPPDEKKETPAHVKVVEQIVQRCSHLLTNNDPRLRLLVIDVITEAIDCLRAEEDVFLPLVHKLWAPLTSRCRDTELQVVAKAFTIICNLGELSGTFIRRRFTKDVLPSITAFLQNNSQTHVKSSSVHSHTTLFKLQVVVLRSLGLILLAVNLNYKDTHAVYSACQSYLRSSQPKELQSAAFVLFETLIKIDSDATWLFLSDIWSPATEFSFTKADINFNQFAVAGTNDERSEYAVNISKLLKLCF